MTQNDTCVIQMTQMTQHKMTQKIFFSLFDKFSKISLLLEVSIKNLPKKLKKKFLKFFFEIFAIIFLKIYIVRKKIFVSFCVVSFCVIQMTRVLCHLNDTNDTTLDSLVCSTCLGCVTIKYNLPLLWQLVLLKRWRNSTLLFCNLVQDTTEICDIL